MKKFIMFWFYLLFVFTSFAQVVVDNDRAHRRYWYYRTRMINDFMKVGKEIA